MSTQPEQPFLHETIAAVYDAETARLVGDRDVPFYFQQAKRWGDPILELACGTGRLVLPLARAGSSVTGLDSSPQMLSIARRRRASEPQEVQNRARLVQGDMRDFQIGGAFSLAFIAFSTFILLTTPEDQERFLRTVRSHLKDGGVLILDGFIPSAEIVARPPGHVTVDPVFHWPEQDAQVFRTEIVVAKDPKHQTGDLHWIYEVIYSDGRTEKYIVPIRLRYTYPQEMVYLLERNGYRIVERLGGWEGEPFEAGRRMIVVAQKAT